MPDQPELAAITNDINALADSGRLTQLLTNVIGNALSATPPDGHVSIVVSGEQHAEVAVTDDGRRLDPEDLERIFQRFERIALPGNIRPSTGSGIGLTIARSIAKAHHGTLTVRSDGLGCGATFLLQLPLQQPRDPLPDPNILYRHLQAATTAH